MNIENKEIKIGQDIGIFYKIRTQKRLHRNVPIGSTVKSQINNQINTY